MNVARRRLVSAAFALVSIVGLPVANAAAALRDKAPASKSTAKTTAKKPAATTSAAAKTTPKPAATTTAAKKPATTTAPKPAATTTAPVKPSGTTTTALGIVIGPGLDTLPEGDPQVKLPSGDRTVSGDSFNVGSWGDITVTIVVTNGKIVAASAELPLERPRSRYLNEHAGLWLNQRAVDNQAAKLEIITGATQTCSGYQMSLQSAIDKAGLGK